MMRLGGILKRARGAESRVQFARKLELSYTFVRAMEYGLRFPSDKVMLDIAERLGENSDDLLLAAYCDRSPLLAEVLKAKGIELPPSGEEEDEDPPVEPVSRPAETKREVTPASSEARAGGSTDRG